MLNLLYIFNRNLPFAELVRNILDVPNKSFEFINRLMLALSYVRLICLDDRIYSRNLI